MRNRRGNRQDLYYTLIAWAIVIVMLLIFILPFVIVWAILPD